MCIDTQALAVRRSSRTDALPLCTFFVVLAGVSAVSAVGTIDVEINAGIGADDLPRRAATGACTRLAARTSKVASAAVLGVRLKIDTKAFAARFTEAAAGSACSAVGRIGLGIDTGIVAAVGLFAAKRRRPRAADHQASGTLAFADSSGTDLPLRTEFAASTAVFRVGREIDTSVRTARQRAADPIGRRPTQGRIDRAGDLAGAVKADLSGGASVVASPTVIEVVFQIDAGPVTIGRGERRARDDARPAKAAFPGIADLSARPAMIGVRFDIDTSVVAIVGGGGWT